MSDFSSNFNNMIHIIPGSFFFFFFILYEVRFIDKHKMEWIAKKSHLAEQLFWKVSEIFVAWAKSVNFRREEQNYVVQNNIDNMAVITSDIVAHKLRRHREKLKRRGEIYSWGTSLICVAPKRLLPVGLNVCVKGIVDLKQNIY